MITSLLFVLSLFSDFYNDFKKITIYDQINFPISLIQGDNLIIYSFFQLLNSNQNGGAIFIDSLFFNRNLIECCIFYNCSVNNNCQGGAIFLKCLNGSNVLNKICGLYCKTSKEQLFQFCLIEVSNLGINNLQYLSISFSSPNFEGLSQTSRFINGNCLSKYNNFSNNFNFESSAGLSFNTKSLLSSFNSISNNKVNINNFYQIFNSNLIYFIAFHNFINNSQIIRFGIIHLHEVKCKINSCIFYLNLGNLFSCWSNSELEINFCYFDNFLDTISINSSIKINYNLNYNFTFIINHYQTYICNAKYPISKILTISKKNFFLITIFSFNLFIL